MARAGAGLGPSIQVGGTQAARVSSLGVLRVGGLVGDVVERVEVVGDGGARQRLVSSLLDGDCESDGRRR